MEVSNVINQKDGYNITLNHYYSEKTPKACMLILHGMAEHKNRYLPFIKFLNDSGIDAYIYNHRGHGTDMNKEDLGFFNISKGYLNVIEDAVEVIHFIENNKRCNKFILMGHSMGSLIARNVVQRYDKIDGVILCGTTHPSKMITIPGLLLASEIKLIYGPKHRSPFINNLIFGGKVYKVSQTNLSNKAVSDKSVSVKSQTFDWLTRNKDVVTKYIEDPYCGFICTISFYQDLLNLTLHASDAKLINKTRKNLPTFIISGSKDPVSNNGKEIKQLLNTYDNLNFNAISSKLYSNCRHELLQELNAEEVMNDIISWIFK